MKVFFVLLFVSVAFSVPGRADCRAIPKTGEFLYYTIEPQPADGGLTLDVSLAFRTKGSETELLLPSEWQGQKELYKAIRNLIALSPDTHIIETKDPWRRRVSFPSGSIVRLRYTVIKDWSGAIDASTYFRVMIGQSYFQLMGRNFLVYPTLPDDDVLPISLEWKNIPPDWKVLGSLGGDSHCTALKARVIKVSSGLFVGGDIRLMKRSVAGKSVFVATRGRWQFADESFASLVEQIPTAERQFWRDSPPPNFLVTLLPGDAAVGNYGGTALEDSFALFMGPRAQLDFATKFLLAHEMFHSWNAAKLGEVQQAQPYWFTEGFTDYYARLILFRAGLITAEEYGTDVESTYREYLMSPLLHARTKKVEEKFYADPDAQRLMYLRGDLLAIRWDELIRKKSNGRASLDSAMRDLLHEAARKEIVLTNNFLAGYFSPYVGPDAVKDVLHFIEDGDVIPKPNPGLSPDEVPAR